MGGVTASTLEESIDDDTRLWDKRLTHLGDRGMLELHKRKLLKGFKLCKMDFCEYCIWKTTLGQF